MNRSLIMNKEKDCFTFLDHPQLAFRFKGSKPVAKGQYRLPFILKLPQKLPGSFALLKKSKKGKGYAENLSISYTFECFVEGLRQEVFHQKVITIKQFLFTEEEIEEDLLVQKKLI